MGFIISLLVVLLIGCVLFWAVKSILAVCKVPDPANTILLVIFVLLILAWAVGYSGLPQGELHFPR